MKRFLIGGIGNVLYADDGVGPYAVRMLSARYRFDSSVEVADLGTPGLDLVDYLADRDTVILVDSVKSQQAPGTIKLYRKPEILQGCIAPRTGPHAPSLTETLLTMELLGTAPADILLIGVAGSVYETGCNLSAPVEMAVDSVINTIVRELADSGVSCEPRQSGTKPDIWWTNRLSPANTLLAI
jgi:hydrogenase maturation protease